MVAAGDTLAIIEAMKMESPVVSPVAGTLRRLYVAEKQAVNPGTPMFAIEPV
jgi:urea carboxylase